MAYNPNNPNGQAAAASSAPVILATNQSDVPVATSAAAVVATPTSNSLAALNATVQYQVEAGAGIYITLTNGPGATTAWVGTVTFQYSTDGGATWSNLTVMPIAAPASSASTTTASANGLFFVSAPPATNMVQGASTVYIRANMTAYTSGTVYFFVQSAAVPNAHVVLPWTYTVTSGQTVLGPIEATGFSEFSVQISAMTTTVLTAQGTNDPTLTTYATLPVINGSSAAVASAATITGAGTYRINPQGYKWIRLQCTTTGTVLTVQGIAGILGQQVTLTSIGNDIGVTVTSGTVTTVSAVTAVASVTSAQVAIPGLITDVASAAIITTTTTATLTPTFGSSYSVTIPVTAVSGTTPTLDIGIEESDDTGTNWVRIYDFPRITATGFYRSPVFPFIGNRVRYVQTVTGTTPSFTRAINRLQSSLTSYTPFRQIIDRTIVLTTLNSTTTSLTTGASKNAQLVVNIGAVTTTAPQLQLQGSDDAGVTWYNIGSALTAVASSTVSLVVNNVSPQLLRANVSTAGVGVTAGYVLVRSY